MTNKKLIGGVFSSFFSGGNLIKFERTNDEKIVSGKLQKREDEI